MSGCRDPFASGARDRDPTGAPMFTPGSGSRPEPPPPPEPERPDQLPPNPEAYDSPRASQARARGLNAPYIAGGDDPDPDRGRREERRLGLLLVLMIVVVVSLGFVLGIVQNILGF
jgi:hypothetical protein